MRTHMIELILMHQWKKNQNLYFNLSYSLCASLPLWCNWIVTASFLRLLSWNSDNVSPLRTYPLLSFSGRWSGHHVWCLFILFEIEATGKVDKGIFWGNLISILYWVSHTYLNLIMTFIGIGEFDWCWSSKFWGYRWIKIESWWWRECFSYCLGLSHKCYFEVSSRWSITGMILWLVHLQFVIKLFPR